MMQEVHGQQRPCGRGDRRGNGRPPFLAPPTPLVLQEAVVARYAWASLSMLEVLQMVVVGGLCQPLCQHPQLRRKLLRRRRAEEDIRGHHTVIHR